MFVDAIEVVLQAGDGGSGIIAWRREKYQPKGGPAGGNGGRGGCVYVKADSSVLSLEKYRGRSVLRARNGQQGGGSLCQGRAGEDLYLSVPCGTLVRDAATREVLFDCMEPGKEWKVCTGGKGGKGNHFFKTSTHQAPNVCTKGTAGEVRRVEFELRLVADVGLVGMPNAGKSMLFSQMTGAKVKVGSYHFTTLAPNLGYVQFDDFSRVLLADVPGVIQDAHVDRGLGLGFLRHIERTGALVFVIDGSEEEGRGAVEDFFLLCDELKLYNAVLLDKPFLVALNKMDLCEPESALSMFLRRYPLDPATVFPISAKDGQGLQPLLCALQALHHRVLAESRT